MTARGDTTDQRGGLMFRWGGKGMLAPMIVGHLARKRAYIEPFFGAGGFFFRVPPHLYEFQAVNDLDCDVVTFFRVLRDRPQELIAKLALTPYALDEFEFCKTDSHDEVEHARRVFVRMRQVFSGKQVKAGWSRTGKQLSVLKPDLMLTKLRESSAYAARLLHVEIDNQPAVKFIANRASRDTMIYSDPPYPADSRKSSDVYKHEMTDADHRELAAAHHAAVRLGASVMVSSYSCDLYDLELYKGWRRVEIQTTMRGTRVEPGETHGRRTEVLYLSYPASEEIGQTRGPAPRAKGALEKALLGTARRRLEIG